MAKVSKSRVVWAINETQSMRQASQCKAAKKGCR